MKKVKAQVSVEAIVAVSVLLLTLILVFFYTSIQNERITELSSASLQKNDCSKIVSAISMVNSNSVDVILASHIIEHIADTEKVLKEWHRILKVGGRIIFLIPDDGAIDTLNPIMNGTGAQRHLHTFTRQAFKDIVDKFNGLDIIENVTVMEGWSFGGVITKS